MIVSPAFSLNKSQGKYPFEKPRGIYVDHAASLSYQHGSVLALALADDLTVYKHWDQGALWEPPHIGLREEINHMGELEIHRFSTPDVVLSFVDYLFSFCATLCVIFPHERFSFLYCPLWGSSLTGQNGLQ